MPETDHQTNLVLRVVPMPSDVNAAGDIFGGYVLSQMDIAGGIAAEIDGGVGQIRTEQSSLEARNEGTVKLINVQSVSKKDHWVVMNRQGELILVENKAQLMRKLGSKTLTLHLPEALSAIPPELAEWNLILKGDGFELEYQFDIHDEHTGIPRLLRRMAELGISFRDLNTEQSSLEDIFVSLTSERDGVPA